MPARDVGGRAGPAAPYVLVGGLQMPTVRPAVEDALGHPGPLALEPPLSPRRNSKAPCAFSVTLLSHEPGCYSECVLCATYLAGTCCLRRVASRIAWVRILASSVAVHTLNNVCALVFGCRLLPGAFFVFKEIDVCNGCFKEYLVCISHADRWSWPGMGQEPDSSRCHVAYK